MNATRISDRLRPPAQALAGVVVGVLLAGFIPLVAHGERVTLQSAGRQTTGEANGAGAGDGATPGVSVAIGGGGGGPSAGGQAGTATGPTTRSGPANAAALGAVRGVDRTARAIKVGAIIIDIAQGAAVGFAVPNLSVEDMEKMFDAYIADLNRRGGIGGLKVEPIYAPYNSGDAASERAACLRLTEDNAVYAVMDVGTLSSPGALCLTKEHGQLAILGGNTGIQHSVHQKSSGLLFTAQAEGERTVRDAVRAYADKGYLKGKTIGIVGDEGTDPGGEVGDALQQALRDAGAKVAYRSRFSADADTSTSQAPVEVSQQRQHGVDTVLLAADTVNVGTRFVSAAESTGWRPTYYTTDWAGYFCDTCMQLMPPSFNGARIFTHMSNPLKNQGLPEPDVQRRCREVYERETGESINWRGVGLEGDAYVVMLLVCGEVTMVEAGAKAAAPALAYPGFIQGLERRGQSWIPPTSPGRLGPGKHDNADLMLEAQYATDCKCWRAVSNSFAYGPYS